MTQSSAALTTYFLFFFFFCTNFPISLPFALPPTYIKSNKYFSKRKRQFFLTVMKLKNNRVIFWSLNEAMRFLLLYQLDEAQMSRAIKIIPKIMFEKKIVNIIKIIQVFCLFCFCFLLLFNLIGCTTFRNDIGNCMRSWTTHTSHFVHNNFRPKIVFIFSSFNASNKTVLHECRISD